MIEGGLQPRFANEALDKKLSGAALFDAQAGMDDLSGRQAGSAGDRGPVYGTHTPRPQHIYDLISVPLL